MAKLTYRLDMPAFRELVLNSPEMVEEMRGRAELGKTRFQTVTAPVGDPTEGDDHPGTFRDSAVVTSGVNGGINKDRAFGRLASTDPRALSKEFGHLASNGRFVEGSHALVRAMDAFGGHGSARVPQTGGRGTAARKKRAALAKRRAAAKAKRQSPEYRAKQAEKKLGFEPPVLE